jgi:hypothetical protein
MYRIVDPCSHEAFRKTSIENCDHRHHHYIEQDNTMACDNCGKILQYEDQPEKIELLPDYIFETGAINHKDCEMVNLMHDKINELINKYEKERK